VATHKTGRFVHLNFPQNRLNPLSEAAFSQIINIGNAVFDGKDFVLAQRF